MCGVVGCMASWLSDAEKERFKELLTVSNLRGYQGAGVIVSNNRGEVNTFKTTQTGTHLAHDPAFNERLYHSKPVQATSLLIGHTRWPTKGAVTLEATHPHEHDGIIGVHNGTIDRIMGKSIAKDESDSSLLYKSFAENGVKETIQETEGAYCLIWVDTKEKTINFLRNEKRPLFLAKMANTNTMFWASERGMLDFVLGRQAGKFEVLNFLPNKLMVYEFSLKHKLADSCVDVQDLHGKAAPAVAAGYAPFLREAIRTWTGTTTGTAAAIAETAKSGGKEGSTSSGNVTPSGTPTPLPMLPRPQPTQSVLSLKDKPRMRWSNEHQTWVEIHPVVPLVQASSTPTTPKITSHGGTPETSKSNEKKQESQSTEGNFPVAARGDAGGPVLRDDELVGERDFSSGPQDISEVMQELFNSQEPTVSYEGYRQTIKYNWMTEECYIKTLGCGCLWCGDAQPDVPTNLWTDVDEFVCESCQGEQFCAEYIATQLGVTREELDTTNIRKIA